MNQALIQHFKIADADANNSLEVLLEKNLIDPTEYLAWAKEHYNLPVLKVGFLEKNNNIDALLDRYKNVFPKNVIPFHELDGILYVMCLEPTPFEAPQNVQYILAPYDVIVKYASKNESSIVVTQPETPETVKENTNPLFKDLEAPKEKSNALEGFSFDNLSVESASDNDPTSNPNENSSEAHEERPARPPDGFSFGEISDIKLEEKKDIPAGLNFPPVPEGNESHVTDQPVNAVDLKSFQFDGLVPVANDDKNHTSSATVTEQKVTPKTVSKAESLIAKTPPKLKTTTSSIPPPPSPSAIGGQGFDGILSTLKKYCDQSMVLIFKNGNLEPEAWDSTWNKSSHTLKTIDVSTPSIFRIVKESQHPYHGHIVPNPINDAFFNSWNKGIYPEHVTICPIIHEKKIYGMVLGTTTKAGAKKYQLHHIQEIANDAFAMIRSQKAA